MTDRYTDMGKEALREECRNYDISYSKLNNDGMRAALRAADAEIEAAHPVEDDFQMSEEELAKQSMRAELVDPRDGNCPGCGIHLSNGLLTPDDEAANLGGKTLYEAGQLNREFMCMGCGHEWGKEYPPYVAPAKPQADPSKPKRVQAKSGSSNGLQIEQNRPTRNGVTRPSAGGKCRGIWDMLDSLGKDVTAAQARETGIPAGFDKTTIMVQFYRWRKFNGIVGRKG